MEISKTMETNNTEILNEISVGPFLKGMFTGIKNLFKSSSDDVAKYASAEISAVVQRLSKTGTKRLATTGKLPTQLTLTNIRQSKEYAKSLTALAEDYSLKTYKKSFSALTAAEKQAVVKSTTKNLDDVINTELRSTFRQFGDKVGDGTLKNSGLLKAGTKTNQITKAINSLTNAQKGQAQSLIKQNYRLIGDGSKGANIIGKLKSGQITVVKNGEFYVTQTNKLGNQSVKVFQINRKTLTALGLIGLTASAVTYMVWQMNKSNPEDIIVLVDENGNPVSDEQTSQFASCVQELLKSKEAILGYTPSGIARVILKNTQYPKGIAFFTNGRVANLETKERGNWKCKSGKAVVSESKKMSFMGLLNEEVGLNNIDITWDSGKQDDGSTPVPVKPGGSKYTDCSSIDINKQGIEVGCKHPIVLEIQKCIFKDKPEYQTGNFGPKTMEKVGGNLITKEFYDKTMANCGSSSNVTTSDVINAGGGNNFPGIRNKVDASRFDYLNNPSSENPTQSSTLNATNDASVASTSTNESPEEFYNRLNNEGLLTGDVGETVVTDANGVQTRYPPTKRIKYKGPDLSAERLQQLDTILGGFSPSYRRIKQKVKGEDMKYVWLQVKTKRKNKK